MNLACLSAFDPVGPTTISHSPADYHQTSNYRCTQSIVITLHGVCTTEFACRQHTLNIPGKRARIELH